MPEVKKRRGRPSKIKIRKPVARQINLVPYPMYAPSNVPLSIKRQVYPARVLYK